MCLLIYFIFDGLRLFFILKTLKTDVKLIHIVKLVFLNLFVANVTPFASGGGVVQIYFLNKKGVSLGDATAATTIRTVIAMTFVFFSTPLVILFEKNLSSVFPQKKVLFYISLFAIFYFSFFYVVIFKNKLVKRIVVNILFFLNSKKLLSDKKYLKLKRKIIREIKVFGRNLAYFFKGDKKYLASVILSTIFFLLAELSFSVILIKGLGYDVSAISIILMQIVIIFFMYFAPTPGATGVAEGSYSFLFSKFVGGNDIVPLIFAWRFLTKYFGMVIGMVIFFVSFLGGKNN
jgi:hypothetical protein